MPSIIHYGWAETTPALRGTLARGAGMLRGTRRKKRKANVAKAKKAKKAKKRAAGVKAYMVKGSPAAKKHMAKLRKLAKKARG